MTDEKPTTAVSVASAPTPAAQVFASLADMARDPTVDPMKMKALVELQIIIMDRDRQAEFNRDKIAALMEMPSIGRKGEIRLKGKDGKPDVVQSRFSKFEDIMRVVKPILARHNLVISFNVDHEGQMIAVQPILSHANGIVELGGKMVLPLDTTGSKSNTQGAGSSASYGKRHSAKAMLNLVEEDEDDDGRGGVVGGAEFDPGEQLLRDNGMAAATGGLTAYENWFKALLPKQRAFMVYKGGHEDLRKAAEAHG